MRTFGARFVLKGGAKNKSWKGVVDLAGVVDYSNLLVNDYCILVPACGLFARLEVSTIF